MTGCNEIAMHIKFSTGADLARPLSDLALQSLLLPAWAMVVSQFATGYRPECHYMRGPGPKCREKQGTRDYQPAARKHAIGRS
jgi:hypothetical protein